MGTVFLCALKQGTWSLGMMDRWMWGRAGVREPFFPLPAKNRILCGLREGEWRGGNENRQNHGSKRQALYFLGWAPGEVAIPQRGNGFMQSLDTAVYYLLKVPLPLCDAANQRVSHAAVQMLSQENSEWADYPNQKAPHTPNLPARALWTPPGSLSPPHGRKKKPKTTWDVILSLVVRELELNWVTRNV